MAFSNLPKITLKSKNLLDLEKTIRSEWLVTNGLGSYASSTVLGANTRKYHGLLIAAFNPPVDRRVLLARFDEEILVDNKAYFLGVNEVEAGRFEPEGYRHLVDFSLAPFPIFTYKVADNIQVKKTVFMPYEKNATIVIYEVSNGSKSPTVVNISPFVNSRHFHSVTKKDGAPNFLQRQFDHCVTLQPAKGLTTLTMCSSADGLYTAGEGEWVETYFRVDARRYGESSVDNSYKTGFFEFDINPAEARKFFVIAVGGKSENETQSILDSFNKDIESIEESYNFELKRRDDMLREFQNRCAIVPMEEWLKWLVLAADTFIVNRASAQAKSVIAGYHWFEDWGRDALISLPGLALVTGRFADTRKILQTFGRYCSSGIIPNRFPDNAGDKPVYNTVDAALWYIDAVLKYLKYTNDFRFVQEKLCDTLESIIANYVKGTAFNIHMDNDSLIAHGPQLTWMDAAPSGQPVTPREGKAVEIQALWYNALKTMQLLAIHLGESEKAQEYLSLAEKTKKSFLKKFWNPEKKYLFDLISDGLSDSSLRPNQVIAVSLDFTVLDSTRAGQIVDITEKWLWGVYGLKTLPENDPRYKGKYKGDWTQRDTAYHNGTVWAWLLGPFVTSFLKLRNYEARWRSYAFKNFLQPLFQEEIFRAGLGTVSEIFDGDPPHEPNGCIAQAWSVAEPLRAYIEDVLLKRPSFEHNVLDLVK
jgi:predicted glycogen debranching enzyme